MPDAGHLVSVGLMLVWAGLGCEVTASVGRDQPESAMSGGGGPLSTGPAEGSSSTTPTDGVADGGGEGEGSGGGVTGRATDDGSGTHGPTTNGEVPPLCQAHDGASACAVCRKGHCCDRIIACHDAPGCFCYWDCIVHDVATDMGCRESCDYDGDEWQALATCQETMCLDICGEGGPTDVPPTTD